MGRRLGFDIDGVLYPWHEIILEQFIVEGRVPPDSMVGDIFGQGKYFDSLPKRIQSQYLYDGIYHSEHVIREGVLDVINVLKKDHDIFYVTARPMNLTAVTRAWAWSIGLPNAHEHLYLADGGKKAVVRALGITTFVEDNVKYVGQLVDVCSVVLLTRPWNEDYNEKGHVRIDVLHELVPLLTTQRWQH